MASSNEIIEGIRSGDVIPFLGPGTLNGVTSELDGSAIPADSDSLILSMNNGQAMAPRLMYEFPRAAMHLENKKGRKFIEKFLTDLYGEKKWTPSSFHKWIASLEAPYVIDSNRDIQLQNHYTSTDHNLIVGVARIASHPYRFDIYEFSGGEYKVVELDQVNTSLPVIFKPLGSPVPKPNYVASDADFVDYITELMGGFAIPNWIKDYRKDKQYVFFGVRFTRDTERMIMSDLIYGSNKLTGWAFIKDPTEKEIKYLNKKKIEIIEQDCLELLEISPEVEVA